MYELGNLGLCYVCPQGKVQMHLSYQVSCHLLLDPGFVMACCIAIKTILHPALLYEDMLRTLLQC